MKCVTNTLESRCSTWHQILVSWNVSPPTHFIKILVSVHYILTHTNAPDFVKLLKTVLLHANLLQNLKLSFRIFLGYLYHTLLYISHWKLKSSFSEKKRKAHSPRTYFSTMALCPKFLRKAKFSVLVQHFMEISRNSPLAWWRHLTTTTRMLWGKLLYSVICLL